MQDRRAEFSLQHKCGLELSWVQISILMLQQLLIEASRGSCATRDAVPFSRARNTWTRTSQSWTPKPPQLQLQFFGSWIRREERGGHSVCLLFDRLQFSSFNIFLSPLSVYIGKRLTTPPTSSFWAPKWREVPGRWPWDVGEKFCCSEYALLSPLSPACTPPPPAWDMTCSQEKRICLFLRLPSSFRFSWFFLISFTNSIEVKFSRVSTFGMGGFSGWVKALNQTPVLLCPGTPPAETSTESKRLKMSSCLFFLFSSVVVVRSGLLFICLLSRFYSVANRLRDITRTRAPKRVVERWQVCRRAVSSVRLCRSWVHNSPKPINLCVFFWYIRVSCVSRKSAVCGFPKVRCFGKNWGNTTQMEGHFLFVFFTRKSFWNLSSED